MASVTPIKSFPIYSFSVEVENTPLALFSFLLSLDVLTKAGISTHWDKDIKRTADLALQATVKFRHVNLAAKSREQENKDKKLATLVW